MVDSIDAPSSERELLLLINEKVITLNKKFDEFKEDNLTKYRDLQDTQKCFEERYQLDMYRVNRKLNMLDGAITFITLIGAVSGFILVFIK